MLSGDSATVPRDLGDALQEILRDLVDHLGGVDRARRAQVARTAKVVAEMTALADELAAQPFVEPADAADAIEQLECIDDHLATTAEQAAVVQAIAALDPSLAERYRLAVERLREPYLAARPALIDHVRRFGAEVEASLTEADLATDTAAALDETIAWLNGERPSPV